MRSASMIAFVAVVAFALAPAVTAQNLLTDPGFEGTNFLTDWGPFGNASVDVAPVNSGTRSLKMFGNFSGGFDVTGVFEEFACTAGDQFQLSCFSRHESTDALIGTGNANPMALQNWVVQKIAFFDAMGVELGFAAVESTILDGTFATDTWHNNAPITGTAPMGAVAVQALLLFLQPMNDGGAGFFDDVDFQQTGGAMATYPGSGDDLTIGSGINALPSSSPDVKNAVGGDWLSLNVASPGAAYDLFPYFLWCQFFPTAGGAGSVPGFPEVHLDLIQPVILLVDPTVPSPIGASLIGPGGGTNHFYVLPPALNGLGQSLIFQTLVTTAASNNGVFAISDAHEVIVP